MVNNYINHIAMVLDGSGSMSSLKNQVIQIADQQIEYLAQRSKETDQETRVSLYVFEGENAIHCHVYDKDVLRLPSLNGLYRTVGNTPLVAATLKAIDDLSKTATLYGEHSFLVYVLTDGENNVRTPAPAVLQKRIEQLPDEWTLACFVPNQLGKREAQSFGFPKDNIAIWDTNAKGIAEVGETIRKTTDAYFTMRSTGVRGTRNLFSLNTAALNKSTVARQLNRLGPGQFRMFPVKKDGRVDEFVEKQTKRAYRLGEAYYQLTVPVKVQVQKQIALFNKKEHAVYTGADARHLLGLPDCEVKVNPAATPDFEIFIQSTSMNRKLLAGTNLLLLG